MQKCKTLFGALAREDNLIQNQQMSLEKILANYLTIFCFYQISSVLFLARKKINKSREKLFSQNSQFVMTEPTF